MKTPDKKAGDNSSPAPLDLGRLPTSPAANVAGLAGLSKRSAGLSKGPAGPGGPAGAAGPVSRRVDGLFDKPLVKPLITSLDQLLVQSFVKPAPPPSRPGFPLRLPADYGMPSASKKSFLRPPAAPAKAVFSPAVNSLKPLPVVLSSAKPALNKNFAASQFTAAVPNQGQAFQSAQTSQPFEASQALRTRMLQKLMAQGVVDTRVLAAMGLVERHRFVDTALANHAYEDTSLAIGLGQTISKPNVVARMLELLLLGRSGKLGRVLEIGTGCGYQAALLGQLASEVYSMERLRGLHDKARENLRPMRLANVHLLFGDGMLGYPSGAPYAAIIAAAGGSALPTAWTDQLAVGGRLVAPLETSQGIQALVVVDKTVNGLEQSLLEAVKFVPLKSGIS